MSAQEPVRTQDLLTCFFSGCETSFRFLERRHGFSYCAGLATYANGRQIIRPYAHEEVTPPFWAVTRYEKDDTAIEIIYGDNNFSFDIFFCPDRIHRFSMSELLEASKKAKVAAEKGHTLLDTTSLREKMNRMAQTLNAQSGLLIDIDEDTIRRAVIGRAKRMEKQIRDQFHTNLKLSLKHAAIAFAQENYRMVVSLLSPYESYLKKGDLKKLQEARESLVT